MSLLDDQQRLAFATFVAGLSIVDFQLRLVEAALSARPIPRPPLRLVSDLYGIEIDPEFIKDV